jgi:hypothetical protein
LHCIIGLFLSGSIHILAKVNPLGFDCWTLTYFSSILVDVRGNMLMRGCLWDMNDCLIKRILDSLSALMTVELNLTPLNAFDILIVGSVSSEVLARDLAWPVSECSLSLIQVVRVKVLPEALLAWVLHVLAQARGGVKAVARWELLLHNYKTVVGCHQWY